MSTLGITIFTILVIWMISGISYALGQFYASGKQAQSIKQTRISFKYHYKVVFKNDVTVYLEEISVRKLKFPLDPSLVADTVRPGTLLKLASNSKEMKLANLSHLKGKGAMVEVE